MWRNDGCIVRNPVRDQAYDLHHLGSCVAELEKIFPDESYTHTYLTVGRGCTFGCNFCDLRRSRVRNRHPNDIAEEMELITILPFGYRAEGPRRKGTPRKPMEEIAHRERFGQPYR